MSSVDRNNQYDLEGNAHISWTKDTPIRSDAFNKTDEEKITLIEHHFSKIMEVLGLDLSDDSLQGTPYRVAKMYVKELFCGLNPKHRPEISTFENKYAYKKMLIEKDINLNSSCEHHFLPIVGKVHVGYIPKNRVLGLSKINRLVGYYAHRPQVQERLCIQILEDLQSTLETEDVIVIIEAKHLCVSSRGIKDDYSTTVTMEYGGIFGQKKYRSEFQQLI